MKIIQLLIKRQLLGIFKFNKFKHGTQKQRKHYILLLSFVCFTLFIFGFLWVKRIYNLSTLFHTPLEILNFLVQPLVIISMLLIFFSAVTRGSGILYADKDTDKLFAYPIEIWHIVISKLVVLYVFSMIIVLFLLLVPFTFYEVMNEAKWWDYIIDIIQLFTIPILPLLIGLIVGYYCYRFLKNSYISNLQVRSILYLTLLLLFMVFAFFFDSKINFMNIFQQFVSNNYLITRFLNVVYFSRNVENLISIILSFLGGYVLFSIILNNYQLKCNHLQAPVRGNTTTKKSYIQRSVLYSMFKREQKRYFSTPVYVINTMVGAIMVVIFVGYSFINPISIVESMNLIRNILSVENTALLSIFTVSILITLTNTTCASISIEGKNHEIIKALPITFNNYIFAKLLLHLSLTIPVICIATLFISLTHNMTFLEIILSILLPSIFSIFAGIVGLSLNLLMPNYEWENVTYIVKQSLPVIITTFSVLTITTGSFWLIVKFFNHTILLASYSLVFIFILLSLSIFYTIKKNF